MMKKKKQKKAFRKKRSKLTQDVLSKNIIKEPYPCLEELLGDEFCYRVFGEETEDWKRKRLSPEQFVHRAGPYLDKENLWLQLNNLCITSLRNPCDEGSYLPSGKFFRWGGIQEKWIAEVSRYAIPKAF